MKGTHILVVDDDPVLREIVSSFLRQIGAAVTTAAGVPEANAALGQHTFDLIISDVHLPGNNRLQWTEQLLAHPEAPPLVLITGNPEIETAMRAANLPVSGYLAKPPDFSTLGNLLHRLISERRQRRELRDIAQEAGRLLAASDDDDPARRMLLRLSENLIQQAERPARPTQAATDTPAWSAAIVETIAVLEKTKHSFRSKELGQLRLRLQRMVDASAPPAPVSLSA